MRQGFICLLVLSLMALIPTVHAGSDPIPIQIGDTVQGELTESALGVTYQLEVTELSFVNISLRSTAFDAYVSIMMSEGEVANNDDYDGSLNSYIGDLALSPGTYSIWVTSSDNNDTGLYTLALLGGSASRLEAGVESAGELTTTNNFHRYTMTGEAGKTYVIQANSVDFNPVINVYPVGFYEYPAYGDDDSGLGTNALAGPYTFSENMDLVIEVLPVAIGGGGGGSSMTFTGAYTVKLIEIEPTIIECNSTTDSTVDTDGAYFHFDYAIGTQISIGVESESDTSLGLYSDFYIMGTDDDSGRGRNPELLNYSFRENYTYTIGVFPSTASATGEFELTVDCVAPTPLTLTAPATVSFDEKHRDAVVVLEDVVAGQGYGLTLTPDNYNPTYSYVDVFLNGSYYTGIYLDATMWGTEIDFVPNADGQFSFFLGGEYPTPLNIEFSIIEKEIEAAG